MSDLSIEKEYLSAKQLHLDGNHEKALEVIKAASSKEGLPGEEQFQCSLLEAKIRLSLEQYEKSQTLADKLLRDADHRGNQLMELDALDLKAEVHWRTGKLNEGMDLIEKALGIISLFEQEHPEEFQNELKRKKQKIYRNAGILYWFKGELDTSQEFHQKCLEINEELGNNRGVSTSLNNLGLVRWSKGEIDEAIKHYQQSLKIVEELEDDHQMATLLNNLGNASTANGDILQGLKYHQLSLEIRRELGKQQDIASSLNNIGALYHTKGNFQEALEYYRQSLQISEQLGNPNDIALTTHNIGDMLAIRGDLSEALDHLQRSLGVFRELDNKQHTAMVLVNLGDAYRKKGEYERAKQSNLLGLELYRQLENKPFVALAHFSLLWMALETRDLDEADRRLEKIQQINQQIENKIVDQRYRVAQAMIYKAGTRAADKIKAQEILEQVLAEEITNHELTVMAMFHLCELLLFEYKMTEEDQVLQKFKSITRQLEEIAKQQSSHSLLIKANMLQSKLAVLEMDLDQAKGLLAEAKFRAREKGLSNLERKVVHEEGLLTRQLHKLESVIEKNIPRKEMISLLGLDDLLQRMVRKTVAVLTEDELSNTREFVAQPKYLLSHRDIIEHTAISERSKSRVGIAQIGLSRSGNIVQDFYVEKEKGLFSLREDMIHTVEENVRMMVEIAANKQIDLLIFPELAIDLGHERLLETLLGLSAAHNIWIVPGSYHDLAGKQNYCRVISPDGILWEQQKQIPAIIHFEGKRIVEGIRTKTQPGKVTIAGTEFGRIVIVICRDFLDMDLRVELKNHEPPIDILINIAFTPVTEDFQAAHFDARRSIYAYCFFANIAEFGNSVIYSPEKSRVELRIPPGEEDLIFQDINLFELRAERKRWEKLQKGFIQSTRS